MSYHERTTPRLFSISPSLVCSRVGWEGCYQKKYIVLSRFGIDVALHSSRQRWDARRDARGLRSEAADVIVEAT